MVLISFSWLNVNWEVFSSRISVTVIPLPLETAIMESFIANFGDLLIV